MIKQKISVPLQFAVNCQREILHRLMHDQVAALTVFRPTCVVRFKICQLRYLWCTCNANMSCLTYTVRRSAEQR